MQRDNPILSVILPAFNCEGYVAQAIESILKQSFTDFELLIADDGSSDSTRSIIDMYSALDPRIRVSHNTSNAGKVRTANKLFMLSKGSLVTVHDADDYSSLDRFQHQVSLLNDKPELVMCGTSFAIASANDRHFEDVFMPVDFDDILKNIVNASQFHGPTMLFRRAAVGDQLYRPFFRDYNEDCDLAFRLIEKGPCTNVPQILYRYRILPHSLSKTITAEKKALYAMALRFYQQRVAKGSDDLMEENVEQINLELLRLTKNYISDPSLIHRQNAAFLMYYRLYKSATLQAWDACKLSPFQFDNWRTLQYCIRKSILGF